MRKVLAAGTAVTLLFAAAPTTAIHANAPAASEKPTPPPEIPKRKLSKQLPKFATQPKVVKSGKKYAVQARVRLIPWHTSKRHVADKADTMKVSLAVATKNREIRYVGLSEKGLLWSGKVGPQVVKRTGTYLVSIPVTKKVGRSLASQTPKQQRQRLRLTVEHRKDVRSQIDGRDVIQLAQSGVDSDKLAGTSKQEGAHLSDDGRSYTTVAEMTNYTPFVLDMSAQGVNCVSSGSWTGTVNSYFTVQYSAQIYTSGTTMANNYDSAGVLVSAAVNALTESAKSAAQSAEAAGAALFTPEGAIAEAADWQINFITDFIKNLVADSCSSQPSLYTTSAAVTGASDPLLRTQDGYYGFNASNPSAPSLVTFPPGSSAYQMYGAQSSTTWNHNGGSPQPSGPGSFNWAGGLISMTGTWSDGFEVGYYFESNAANPTGFGPAPAVWPPNGGVTNSGSLTAQWNGGNMVLSCDPGEWNLFNPWGSSLAITPGALTPANTNQYSGNQMYMAVAYNGTDAQGNEVYNESFTGVEPVTAYSTETQSFTVDSSVLQGITVDEWQCSVGTALEVGDWSIPSAWPTAYMGTNPNGSWTNAPNMVLTAPYVAP
jgi:hypothetical protein